jgi:hypothetical protein
MDELWQVISRGNKLGYEIQITFHSTDYARATVGHDTLISVIAMMSAWDTNSTSRAVVLPNWEHHDIGRIIELISEYLDNVELKLDMTK